MAKLLSFTAWLGFCDGKPHFYANIRHDGQAGRRADLFSARSAGKIEYEDIRRVRVLFEAPVRKVNRGRK